MSTFYGNLRGNRGEVTRQGSKASGIVAVARSWQGSIRVDLDWSTTLNAPTVHITAHQGSSADLSGILYHGPLSDLLAPNARFTLTTDKES
jgi:hypothetical protein